MSREKVILLAACVDIITLLQVLVLQQQASLAAITQVQAKSREKVIILAAYAERMKAAK